MTKGRYVRSGCGALIIAAGMALAAPAMADDALWIRQFGKSATEYAYGVATDADGNAIVVGTTTGGASAGSPKGLSDAFVIKFGPDHEVLWKRQPGSVSFDGARDVAADANGNVFVVGYTRGQLAGSRKGNNDVFILKYDADGKLLWKRQPGSRGSDIARRVATDAAGNAVVVGETSGALGGALKGRIDAFVIKYDADGRVLWKRQPGTVGQDYAEGVATDRAGNVYVIGSTTGALGGTNKGNFDAFVVKLDAEGRFLWKRQPGRRNGDLGVGIATDAAGNVYAVGTAQYPLYGGLGASDVVVIKFDGDGTVLWKRLLGTSYIDSASGIAVDAAGNVYVVGSTNSLPSGLGTGPYRGFFARLDADGKGTLRFLEASEKGDYPEGIAVDPAGNVYVAGWTLGKIGEFSRRPPDGYLAKYPHIVP
ncbi:MAG: SBBP repeat-containing protein [Rhodospirillales bacterium]|nr:SBBP repeat-containing protein [Rhodospirillales bacterium]